MATDILSSAMVLEVLRNDCYENWSVCLKNYLLAQDLWDIIEEANTEAPKPEDDEENFKVWRKKNAAALLAIQISCGSNMLSRIRKIDSAKAAWDELARLHEQDCFQEREQESLPGIVDPAIPPHSIGANQGVNEAEIAGNASLQQSADESNPPQLTRVPSLNRSNSSKPKSRSVQLEIVANEEKVKGKEEEKEEEESQRKLRGVNQQPMEEVNQQSIVNAGDLPQSTSFNTSNSAPLPEFSQGFPGTASSLPQPTLVNQSNPVPESSQAIPGTDEYLKFQPLVQTICSGNENVVRNFIDETASAKTAKINAWGITILHLASECGRVKIVEEMVQSMSEEEVTIQDSAGHTALHRAALNGNIQMADCMISKNKSLVNIANRLERLPVNEACDAGHKKLARYLYSVTSLELCTDTTRAILLYNSIAFQLFDVALDLIRRYPHLIIDAKGLPLLALARSPVVFTSDNPLVFWKQLIYRCIHVRLPSTSNEFRVDIPKNEESHKESNFIPQVLGRFLTVVGSIFLDFFGIKELYDMKLNQLYASDILQCICKKFSTLDLARASSLDFAVMEAIQNGKLELLIELCKANPLLLLIKLTAANSRNLLFLAIQFRQEKIFSLIYGVGTIENSMISSTDSMDNTVLHAAGMMAPSSRLARISGAALQMQRELQWYKEVESVLKPSLKFYRNFDNYLPHQLFTKTHEDLLKQGEKWMKENATSFSFVAALILTVMFAAVFSIPGGNDSNTGYPMFLHKKTLKVFVISDAISLFSATTSVLIFLGILTSRYAEGDFLRSLPTKLIIGLSTLFISIAAMMVAFCTALIILLKGQLSIIIPIVVLAGFPIAVFVWLQFPLLVQIFISTYGPGIFNKKMKPWLNI